MGRHSPSLHRWPFRAKLETPEALRLAALWSVTVDLDQVIEFCQRLRGLSAARDEQGAPRDDLDFNAFWIAALVTYARCFDKGRRVLALSEEDVGTPESLSWHETFIALRDQHVAHPVDTKLEGYFVDAFLTSPQSPTRTVEAVSVSGHKRTSASTEYVEALLQLARSLRKQASARIEVLRDAVLAQARARPIDEFYAAGGSEIVLPDVSGPRPRSLDRRRRKDKRKGS